MKYNILSREIAYCFFSCPHKVGGIESCTCLYICPCMSSKILWHQLLIYSLVDLFQTCTNDQSRCIDGRKIDFFLQPFLLELLPFVNFIYSLADFFKLVLGQDVQMMQADFLPANIFTRVLASGINYSFAIWQISF